MAVSNLKTVIESVLAPYLVAIEKYHAQTANSLMYDEVKNLIAEFDATEQRLSQVIADLRSEMTGDITEVNEQMDDLAERLNARIDELVAQHQQDMTNIATRLADLLAKHLWIHDVVTLDGQKYLVRADTAEGIRLAAEYDESTDDKSL